MQESCHFDVVNLLAHAARRLSFFPLILCFTVSCATGSRSQLLDNLDIEKGRPNFMPRYVLDQSLSQGIYLKILEAEIKNGFAIDPKYTHANSGLILCAVEPATKVPSCLLYGLLADRVNPTFIWAMDPETTSAILAHYKSAQNPKKIASESVYMDLFCSYFGKNNPPFGVQEAVCFLDNYRTLKQVYLTKVAAQEVMLKLSNSRLESDGNKTADGVVTCRWDRALNRMICYIESSSADQMKSASAPLSSSSTYPLTRQFSLKSFAESRDHVADNLSTNMDKAAFSLRMACSYTSRDQEYFCAGVMVDGT